MGAVLLILLVLVAVAISPILAYVLAKAIAAGVRRGWSIANRPRGMSRRKSNK
jgi:threonine/homoserine/homoserine lactone efflux protein